MTAITPIIGIVGNAHLIDGRYPLQGCGVHYLRSVREVCNAMPVILPALPESYDFDALFGMVDGIILTGGRPNVHPRHWGEALTDAHGTMDEARDAVAFELVRRCVDLAVPILGICRGFQEMAVTYGSGLHPEIRDLPGRMNHRMPPDENNLDIVFRPRHTVQLSEGGVFERIFGAREVVVNSLHGQGVERPGARVLIEGRAEDGTAEALAIKDAPGFALGVQWHAEYKAPENPVNRALFAAFGEAASAYRKARN
ncbi:MAG: gamma-glutamyl-gamma-aminobutyrate hydrolase family protein [Neomegalonema sp.]|nr:gamma-glutamyl-gamma-aminobutyrate hydrolase family protein [Neomegalonema sp.]